MSNTLTNKNFLNFLITLEVNDYYQQDDILVGFSIIDLEWFLYFYSITLSGIYWYAKKIALLFTKYHDANKLHISYISNLLKRIVLHII